MTFVPESVVELKNTHCGRAAANSLCRMVFTVALNFELLPRRGSFAHFTGDSKITFV